MLNLDGPTVKLTYEGGELIEMSTQGEGNKGEDVTHNTRSISGIPAKITCQEPVSYTHLTLPTICRV